MIPGWFAAVLLTWVVVTFHPRWRMAWTTKTVLWGYALIVVCALPAFLVAIAIARSGEAIAPSLSDLGPITCSVVLGVATVGLYARGQNRKTHR